MGMMMSEDNNEAKANLSQREIEVLSLILEGQSSKQVADVLCCAKRTVDFHLSNAYRKLHVSNRIQAMRTLVVSGLIDDLNAGIKSAM